MTTITVTAHRWQGGWELHTNGDPITQARTLPQAPQQVRDYYDTIDPDVDHSGWTIEVIPDIGPLGDEVTEVRAETREAEEAVSSAARRARSVVRHLREAGYSVTDSAAILGVSRGRISQLVKPGR